MFYTDTPILKSYTLFIRKITIYLLIHNIHFCPSAQHRYSVFVPTEINFIYLPNVGTLSMYQSWMNYVGLILERCQCTNCDKYNVGPMLVQRRSINSDCSQPYNHMPTFGQRELAIWVMFTGYIKLVNFLN